MASSAPAGSPFSVAGQPPPPPPPPPPLSQPPEVASAPATTVSPPPPPLAPPPLPPPAPPPSPVPASSPPPPSTAAAAPSPPPLLPPGSPPAKPNSTVTPPTPPSTAAPPPTSAPPSVIPTAPAAPRTPPTPSLPQAPPYPSKSTLPRETPPPSHANPIVPPPSVPRPATPSPPGEARPRPTEAPAPPSPAYGPQSPAMPSPVPPGNQPSSFQPSTVTSPGPPPLTPPVTPVPAPPGNSTATLPLPRQLANGSLPVAVGGQPGQHTETASHIPAGLIAGAAMCGVALIVMLGILLFVCFKCKRKQGPTAGKDSYGSFSSGVKDGVSAAPPQGFQHPNENENVQPQSRAHVIAVPPKAFAIAPPNLGSGRGGSSTANWVPELHPPLKASLSFSRGTFTYDELVEATNSFSEANLLGEGGFGYVHKGVLPNGKEIAVKQLKIGSHQGEREFQAELDIISRVHHKHLVTLLGYCITRAGRFLVYEFVPNNNLEFHLHGKGRPVLNWRTRLKIAIGTAKGLAYLQEDCSPTIIHRDIKAANILLDFNFEAKVSDFGLAKFFSDNTANVSHISTRVVGTFGYLAPEYASSGKLTEKSDVYSFGVMLLELVTGSPPIMRTESSSNEGHGLVDWARPLLNQASETGEMDKIVDPRLRKDYDSDEMLSMIGCAAACVRHSAWLRPRMSQIVRALEGEGSLADLDDGIRPGQSKVYGSSEMRKFSMILGSREDSTSRQSDNTSEYGLYPSCSSSETGSR